MSEEKLRSVMEEMIRVLSFTTVHSRHIDALITSGKEALKAKTAQSQADLEDQLNALDQLAAKNGLYDAQDWLRQVRENAVKLVR